MKQKGLSLGIALALGVASFSLPMSNAAAEPVVPEWRAAQTYKASVPTIEQVLGYPAGSRISSPQAIEEYFLRFASAFPNQVVIREYAKKLGRSFLFSVAIGSEKILEKLAEH